MRFVRCLYKASLCVGILTSICLIGMIGAFQAQAVVDAPFTLGPDMNVARMSHSIANLPAGKVAVFGGHGTGFVALGSAEIWDPATNSFSLINMNSPRDMAAIAKLQDGRLLLAGGAFNLGVAPGNNTAEIFDPVTTSFSPTNPMTYGRTNCNSATLTSGKVIIVGGWYNVNSCTYAELFDPSTGSFAMTGALSSPRAHPVVLPTHDGKAVVLGGIGVYGTPFIERVEIFDPSTNAFTIFQENLFAGETGWSIMGPPKKPIEAQRLGDGRYVLHAWRLQGGVYEYTLFTFDPLSKAIAKLPTTPALPNSDSFSLVFAPMVDPTGSKVHLLARINPPIEPYQYKLLAINTTTGQLAIPEDSCPLPAAAWYVDHAAATVLPEGRMFVTGGSSTEDANQNFNPVTKTLFAEGIPSLVQLDIRANGSDGPIVVSPSNPVAIDISLDPRDQAGVNAEWWIVVQLKGHFGMFPQYQYYSYVHPTGWLPGINRCVQVPLMNLSPVNVLAMTLPRGDYEFFFVLDDQIDLIPDGKWMDSVKVLVQ